MSSIKVHPYVVFFIILAMGLMIYRNISCYYETLALSERLMSVSQPLPLPQSSTSSSTSSQTETETKNLRGNTHSLNLAPHMTEYPESCGKPVLWGTDHQGGWYICQDQLTASSSTMSSSSSSSRSSAACLIYSYGLVIHSLGGYLILGADWSFDNAAEAFGCEVHGFDPSGPLWRQGMYGGGFQHIDYARVYPSKHKAFHNWGIGAADIAIYPPGTVPQDWPGLGDPPFSFSNPEPWEMRSVERTLTDLGHSNRTLSVLKIDVEGAEWDSLQAFLGSSNIRHRIAHGHFPQLLLEFHWDPESRARNGRNDKVLKMVAELGYVPWKVNRHKGSDCCLDVSYVWKKGNRASTSLSVNTQ
eukprot:scaffold156_cov173-Ochromonas_danica.AAC.11